MNNLKIVFMGTPEFAVLPLVELAKKHDVKLVVTQEDKRKGRGKKVIASEVKQKAEELGIDIYQPTNINDEESINKLKSVDADIFIVVAFGQILKKEVLEIPKFGAINIHASLLPKLRGAAPINRAIINGDKKTGISIMKMDTGLDTGDVALFKEIEIGDMNSSELSNELSKLGAELIIEFIDKLNTGSIKYQKQDDRQATYAQKITKETQIIDFNSMSTAEILCMIKGLTDRGGSITTYKGEVLKIYNAEKFDVKFDFAPGTVINKLIIKTKDSAIEIKELQLPGKKRMFGKDFLLGNQLEEGVILGG